MNDIVKTKPFFRVLIAVLIAVVEVFVIVLFASDLYGFFKNPDAYHVGSEAMIGSGGWMYKSNFTFIFYGLMMIAVSATILFLAIRSKVVKFSLLILLLSICQIGFIILV